MNYSCSQCSFAAQFESALTMHHQLHHEGRAGADTKNKHKLTNFAEKSKTVPHVLPLGALTTGFHESKGIKLRTASATRLFGKIRAKICRSRTMFAHPEEADRSLNIHDLSASSECTSKAMKDDSIDCRTSALPGCRRESYSYGCHLCHFEADRITVLDRHLLNHHKIGIETLLKLVMAKTKDGLSEDSTSAATAGVHQPYYKPLEEVEDEAFVIETVSPKIKIVKHASTNTDVQWSDIPNLKANCQLITKELDKLIKCPTEGCEKDDLLKKMQTLNECMCKFVDSSNTLKKVLTKQYDSRSVRGKIAACEESFFNLKLRDQDTPRQRMRARSESMDRGKKEYGHKCKYTMGDHQTKLSAESFYF